MIKLSEILNAVEKCDNIQEIDKNLWMIQFVEQAMQKQREKLIIEKIKNLDLEEVK